MKKLLFFTTASFFLSFTGKAQIALHSPLSDEVFIGPVMGFGDSWVSNLKGTNEFLPSGYLGIMYKNYKNRHWGYGGQLEVSAEGYKISLPGTDGIYGNLPTYTPVYIRMPLRVYYFFGNYPKIRPEIFFGPSLALKLEEYNTTGITDRDLRSVPTSSEFRTFDAGFDGGVGLSTRLSRTIKLSLDVEYYQGVIDALKSPVNTIDVYNLNHFLGITSSVIFGIK